MTILRLYDFTSGQAKLLHEVEVIAPFQDGWLLVDEVGRHWLKLLEQPNWPDEVSYKLIEPVGINTKGVFL